MQALSADIVYAWYCFFSALNELDVLDGDIQNTYLNAPKKEKLSFYTSDEWKPYHYRIFRIIRALCRLISSTALWKNHLAAILGNKLEFKSYFSGPDVWYKSATDETGFDFEIYIHVYVDDILDGYYSWTMSSKETLKNVMKNWRKCTFQSKIIGCELLAPKYLLCCQILT